MSCVRIEGSRVCEIDVLGEKAAVNDLHRRPQQCSRQPCLSSFSSIWTYLKDSKKQFLFIASVFLLFISCVADALTVPSDYGWGEVRIPPLNY